jgi:plastocyanin
MTMQFRTVQETKVYNDAGQMFPEQIYNATLAAGVATAVTVPGGSSMGNISSYSGGKNYMMAVIRLSYGDEVWFSVNKTAAAPAGAAFAAATSEVVTSDNPKVIRVAVGDVMSFFSVGATSSVSVSFYSLPA